MPRKPRVQFPDAIYHIVTRGDGRRELFHDVGHYERFTEGLKAEVLRSDWQVIAYCWMPNHIHLLLKTPEPNLAVGMQHWLSGYANWYAKRNRRSGHLFQGRYKAFQVENESYYWTLSRYIHLNPCVGRKPLAGKPQDWAFSSYPGYANRRKTRDWVDTEQLYSAWRTEFGGKDPILAYRRFVQRGMSQSLADPLEDALDAWVIGSKRFLKRIVRLGSQIGSRDPLPRRRRVFSSKEVIEFVASEYGVDPDSYVGFRSQSPGRDVAALLCRELTRATLAELSNDFGLHHPDSSANLVRRAKRLSSESKSFERRVETLKSKLTKTENQV